MLYKSENTRILIFPQSERYTHRKLLPCTTSDGYKTKLIVAHGTHNLNNSPPSTQIKDTCCLLLLPKQPKKRKKWLGFLAISCSSSQQMKVDNRGETRRVRLNGRFHSHGTYSSARISETRFFAPRGKKE